MSSSTKCKAPALPNKHSSKPCTACVEAIASTLSKPVHRRALCPPLLTPDISINEDWEDDGDWHQPSDQDEESDVKIMEDDPDPVTVPKVLSPAKPKHGRPPKQTQVGKGACAMTQTFKLPAFIDIATLTNAFVNKVVHMLKLAIVHDQAKSKARKERSCYQELSIQYLKETTKYKAGLSESNKCMFHERKLEEAKACHKAQDIAKSCLHKEKVKAKFKLTQCQKELKKYEKDLKDSNELNNRTKMLNSMEEMERLLNGES